ncbi:MAG: hypothetical protein GVY26_00395 [Bacteroidetes bacterium]|jgi:hypothetical protein|nr:hypothetical protein [Bacteroidota bacterium]
MIEVQHSVVNEEQFPYRTPSNPELEAYECIHYRASSIEHQDFFSLLSSLLHKTLKNYQLYFVQIESKPQPTRPTRSHKKMLYQALKSGQLVPAEVWEEELENSSGYSLLSAVIQGNRDNLPYLIEQQLHANFRFGCILPKTTSFSPAELLLELPRFLRPASKLTRVDAPRLLQHFSAKQAHIFQLPADANDKLQLTLFAHRKDHLFTEIVSSIDQEYALPQSN